MTRYEYKVVSGVGGGGRITMQEAKRWAHLEEQINKLTEDGWEVVSSSTASVRNFIMLNVATTFVLRKAKDT